MGRVRLHSGGISAGLVRLSRRGASERRTAPGTDINEGRGPDTLECGWCGSRKGIVGTPRRRRCGPCLTDETTVQGAKQALKDANQPPLTAPVPDGAPYGKARRRGLAAQDRLDARKKQPQGKAVKPANSQRAAGAERGRAPTAPPRRAAKRAGAAADDVAAERRLQVRIADLERQLAAGKGTPADRALLTERLAASRDTRAALRNRD